MKQSLVRLVSIICLSWLLAGSYFLLVGTGVGLAHHPGEVKLRYVAEFGRDTGRCDYPTQPCRTINYALAQAQKGDEIRVAAGTYFVEAAVVQSLLGGLIAVRGGFTPADGFTVQDPATNLTNLKGVSYQQRANWEQRGFHVLQDAKGWLLNLMPRQPQKGPKLSPTPCQFGMAGPYACNQIDFLGRIALDAFTSQPFAASDIWGFVDLNDNREYALIGLYNGTAVVDVTDPTNPVEVGTISGLNTAWRDIKVYQIYDQAASRWRAYAYVVADQVAQGLQIIDLTNLPESVSLAATYNGFAMAHNIYMSHVDYTTGLTLTGSTAYAYIAGSNLDGGVYHILDLSNPLVPVETIPSTLPAGYTHDVTTLVITDSRTTACEAGNNPCEILIDYNESTVNVWDVTDKANPVMLSAATYPNVAYIHSGWWTADKRYAFIQDESDELGFGLNSTLRLLNLSDLLLPTVSTVWTGTTRAIDHNGFVKGERYYMSNYQRGLTVLDISDPTAPQEVAFFDTYPAGDLALYNGAWGVYPYLPSGTILISDIESGLILVKEKGPGETETRLYLPLIWRD